MYYTMDSCCDYDKAFQFLSFCWSMAYFFQVSWWLPCVENMSLQYLNSRNFSVRLGFGMNRAFVVVKVSRVHNMYGL